MKIVHPPHLRRGRYYKLLENIGPIPKGIYFLKDILDLMLVFSAGRRVEFIISGLDDDKIRAVPHATALAMRTRSEDFAREYFKLLPEFYLKDFSSDGPFTGCMLHPSLQKYCRQAQSAGETLH